MIVRARTVLTIDGRPIGDGAVVVDGGRIVDVGPYTEVQRRHTAEALDLGDRVLLPGLINAHCHLDYTCLQGRIPPPESFTQWIAAINRAKADLSPNDYVASINEGFNEARRFGTTTILNLTAVAAVIERTTAPMRTCWFPELIDVRAPGHADEIVDQAVEALGQARFAASPCCGLAPHAPFTASPRLYRRSIDLAPVITTHIAESTDEMQMFRDASGPLYEFLSSIGRDMSDCGGNTPMQEFLRRIPEPVLERSIVVHANELTDDDLTMLRHLRRKFHVVHCPRNHAYFRHSRFPFAQLRRLGFNIALGTDSLASNDDLNLFAEMRQFRNAFSDVRPSEILEMVTTNAARAIGCKGSLGVIRAGARADLIALPSTSTHDFAAEIMDFTGRPWLMLDGVVMEQ